MSLPRYPAYKDSGVEWLGEAPAHWLLKPLWTFFRRVKRTGYEEEQLLSIYRDHGVVPKASREDNFNKPSDDLSLYQLVVPGDLAINKMKAWQGSVAISTHRGIVSPAYFVYGSLHSESNRYLHYLMRSVRYITGYLSVSKGIRINQWDLEPQLHSRMLLMVPPLEEQAHIAEFLDRETAKIDALVAEQQRLIDLLKEKRQAVISHAVTKGLNPNAPMKDSGIEWLGEVPAHWSLPPLYMRYEQALGKMLDQAKMTGLHPMPYIRNIDVRWDHVNVEDLPVMDVAPHERARFTVMNGDLLMVEGRELGRCAIWSGEDGTVVFQKALHRLRPRANTEHTRFFYYTMVFANRVGVFFANVSPDEIPHLTGEELRRYRFPKPPLDEQRQIARFLDDEDRRYEAFTAEATRAIDLLTERRTALISAAVTGQIDVRPRAQKS